MEAAEAAAGRQFAAGGGGGAPGRAGAVPRRGGHAAGGTCRGVLGRRLCRRRRRRRSRRRRRPPPVFKRARESRYQGNRHRNPVGIRTAGMRGGKESYRACCGHHVWMGAGITFEEHLEALALVDGLWSRTMEVSI